MNQKSFFALSAAAVITTTLLACDDGYGHHHGDGYDDYPDDPGYTPSVDASTAGDPDSGTSTSTPSTTPMLVVVDTGQVMNADPGQGVGIFTEYAAGGAWHVWWTCDTSVSSLPCDVNLTASVASGAITNLDTTELAQDGQIDTSVPNGVTVTVETTTQVHGMKFTSDPGAILTLQATIGGLSTGPGLNKSFFFFVQDGKINGGYTGLLTNPLQFQGSTP